jgi:hypothetical protein
VPQSGKAPTMSRGAKSRKNLKQGGRHGRPPQTAEQKAEDKLATKIAKKLLLDPVYVAGLAERLNSGRCQPGVEVAVWQYAFGRPIEKIETKDVTPIRISHEYSE